MDTSRLLRHLATSKRHLRRAFPPASLAAIEQAVAATTGGAPGTIRFVIESALPIGALLRDQSGRDRAVELFAKLHVWDTEHNHGVLIYLLLADRAIEIVADRGIHARIEQAQWDALSQAMAGAFGQARYEIGMIETVQAIGRHQAEHFHSDR